MHRRSVMNASQQATPVALLETNRKRQAKPSPNAEIKNTISICSSAQRQSELKAKCSSRKAESSPNFYRNLFVDDFHRVIVCVICKSGSTSLKNWLGVHSPKWDGKIPPEKDFWKPKTLKRVGISRLDDFSQPERDRRLQEYFKFVTVRHPFDRLVSAFIDKFANPQNNYYPNLFRKVIRSTIDVDVRRRRLAFEEFVHMIELNYTGGSFVDNHWKTFDELCNPCAVQYDAIAKIETLEHDMAPYWHDTTQRLRTVC